MVFAYIFEGQQGIFCVINVWLNNLVDFMDHLYTIQLVWPYFLCGIVNGI